jgi:hypothetical protein
MEHAGTQSIPWNEPDSMHARREVHRNRVVPCVPYPPRVAPVSLMSDGDMAEYGWVLFRARCCCV